MVTSELSFATAFNGDFDLITSALVLAIDYGLTTALPGGDLWTLKFLGNKELKTSFFAIVEGSLDEA